jgi:hypothetical protein
MQAASCRQAWTASVVQSVRHSIWRNEKPENEKMQQFVGKRFGTFIFFSYLCGINIY